jgi:hypothetical protein
VSPPHFTLSFDVTDRLLAPGANPPYRMRWETRSGSPDGTVYSPPEGNDIPDDRKSPRDARWSGRSTLADRATIEDDDLFAAPGKLIMPLTGPQSRSRPQQHRRFHRGAGARPWRAFLSENAAGRCRKLAMTNAQELFLHLESHCSQGRKHFPGLMSFFWDHELPNTRNAHRQTWTGGVSNKRVQRDVVC